MQDRVQVFNNQWQLLIAFGGHGLLPGQFQGLVDIAIDKNNRVFTSEIYPGRVQQFRYVTDAEADQLQQGARAKACKEGGRSQACRQRRRRCQPATASAEPEAQSPQRK